MYTIRRVLLRALCVGALLRAWGPTHCVPHGACCFPAPPRIVLCISIVLLLELHAQSASVAGQVEQWPLALISFDFVAGNGGSTSQRKLGHKKTASRVASAELSLLHSRNCLASVRAGICGLIRLCSLGPPSCEITGMSNSSSRRSLLAHQPIAFIASRRRCGEYGSPKKRARRRVMRLVLRKSSFAATRRLRPGRKQWYLASCRIMSRRASGHRKDTACAEAGRQ